MVVSQPVLNINNEIILPIQTSSSCFGGVDKSSDSISLMKCMIDHVSALKQNSNGEKQIQYMHDNLLSSVLCYKNVDRKRQNDFLKTL